MRRSKSVRSEASGNRKYPSSALVYVDTDFTGFNELMRRVEPYMAQEVSQALESELEEIKSAAQEIVPYEKGKLQDEAVVIVDDGKTGGGVSGSIIFSAENPRDNYNYAYVQEVRDDWSHLPGRQSRYLETSWERGKAELELRVQQAINRATRRAANAANRKAAAVIKPAPAAQRGSSSILKGVGEKLAKVPALFGKLFGGRRKK